jgi:hypothetical protein
MHLRSPGKLTSGSYINLNVYQTEIWFAMVFSVAEIVSTILGLHVIKNPDRVHDVTAEPFTAPPPDPEKCPDAVTANFAVSFSINAARGGCMSMQTAAQSEGAFVAHQ